jgi:hypothetical protein
MSEPTPGPIVAIPAEASVEESGYVVDVIQHIDSAWDTVVSGFSDVCLEQTAAYMATRWGNSRLCGLVLRGAMTGEPEAAALVLVAAVPMVKTGLAYVKFGPLWRRPNRPARPSVLDAALAAVKREFSGLRGLLTRVMPPAEPELAPAWQHTLDHTGFRPSYRIDHPERYLVNLALRENEQLASLGGKWRANLRKASADVEVREADPQKSLPLFLDLYREMGERKRFADHHHVENLPRFMEAATPALSPRLFFAFAGDRPVAGSIVVGSGERVFVPFSASSAEALPLRAGYALRWGIINRLRDSPARWLDLGGDEGDEGLRHFKTGNVGTRGQIAAIPGEFDAAGTRMSSVVTAALHWAQELSHSKLPQRLLRRGDPADK